MELLADIAQPTIFTLAIVGSYTFPADGTQSVEIYYDHGLQTFTGMASGNSIAIPLDGSNFSQFLHGFTAGRSMLIAEPGHPRRSINLAGSSAAISALGQCTEAHAFTQLPPPWHAPSAYEIASAQHAMGSTSVTPPPSVPAIPIVAPGPPGVNAPATAAASAPPSDPNAMPVYQTDNSPQETDFWQTARMYWDDLAPPQKQICTAVPPGGAQPTSYEQLALCTSHFYMRNETAGGGSGGQSEPAQAAPSVAEAAPVSPSDSPAADAPITAGVADTPPTDATPQAPTAGALEAIVAQYADAYDQASSDFAKGAEVARRSAAICKLLTSLEVTDWPATIETLSSNHDGLGVLEVRIGPHTKLDTYNNALSDMGSDTLIKPSEPFFDGLASMHESRPVIVSGRFLPDQNSCITESSLTQAGSMDSPDFIFKFTDVRAAQ
ncbi:hypothetical protein [Acidisoma silvae]|uniref:Uncharacterized protein n=1 Tax=Acidisoma silvae TaxID=2802396 RepID=A0A963YWU8_9PROT|nr:hypothetical protein [Acidisoma silvae]MCB8877613.1 hypothetical protein [Acidisoma silvae]